MSRSGSLLVYDWRGVAATAKQAMHDFVAKCLDKEAMARLDAADLLKHPFIKRAKDERYLAQRLLGHPMLKPSRSFFMARHASGSPDNTTVRTSISKFPTRFRWTANSHPEGIGLIIGTRLLAVCSSGVSKSSCDAS